MTKVAENQTVAIQNELFLIRTYDSRGIGSDEHRYIEVWNNTEKKIQHLLTYSWTCFGEGGTTYATKPMNEDIKALVDAYKLAEFNTAVDKQIATSNAEIDAFNESRPYQRKGQTVEVIKGKNNGFNGVVFWEGNDAYKRSYRSNLTYNQSTILGIIGSGKVCSASNFDRIGIKDAEGKTIFVSTDNCKVVGGFQPIAPITREKAMQIVKQRSENWAAFFGEN
jgi:hypothetical protein